MLDVSIRAGILNMMVDLRDREDVSLLYITHDLASARYVADRIVVMYAGQIAEAGPTETVLSEPKHPYTRCCSRPSPIRAKPTPSSRRTPASRHA